ncbi:hypothetical protein DAPPUDRAFT_249288 [Daphnia pulex]|uniref:Uncharacterized protein n=1 Tax=Daphnia pulex TaxID=6669 RepID=E9GWC3_DAPPU|nr:hypothetical protein DAPPUDRAFT_249288 [Daphnia pulex]|eukprot:EFX76215.1 hypothetical protein DAPPUDRAFT_249288 [Daphnia pulex]
MTGLMGEQVPNRSKMIIKKKHKEAMSALSDTPSVQLPKWIKQSSVTLMIVAFEIKHCGLEDITGAYSKPWIDYDGECLKLLVETVVLRRMKDDKIQDTNLPLITMPKKGENPQQIVLVLLLRLRQCCSHPALIGTMLAKTDFEWIWAEEGMAKNANSILEMSKENPKGVLSKIFGPENPVFDQSYVLLVSLLAGGTGLNLIGASQLSLFIGPVLESPS